MKEIVIIGGGAAGLAAACAAAEAAGENARVTVLEGAQRMGRKILASGNGRCNLMNAGKNCYFGHADFAEEALSACTRQQVLHFFERAGLQVNMEPEEDGRMYPATGQASSVLDALRAYAGRLRVQCICEEKCVQIIPRKKGYLVETQGGAYRADQLIVCCGSPAGGKLGMDSYHLLTDLGHTLIPPRPALSPLLCDMRGLGALKGLRLPVVLTLTRSGVPVEGTEGEILFSETGVSGVCVMQLARAAQKGDVLHVDFAPLITLAPRRHHHAFSPDAPGLHEKAVLELLKKRAAALPREDLLTGLLPRVLSQTLEKEAKTLPALANRLADFQLTVLGVKGMDSAQVAHGGISAMEFDGHTMESRLHPGLHAAGEVLHVDGECGGFNLLFAWSSGLLSGWHAANNLING